MVSIMSGMQFDEVDDFVTSAISEIANIISGNVMTALSDNDIKCDMLPPVQYKPNAEDKKEKEYEMKTSCYLGTTIGDVCLEIRLNRAS